MNELDTEDESSETVTTDRPDGMAGIGPIVQLIGTSVAVVGILSIPLLGAVFIIVLLTDLESRPGGIRWLTPEGATAVVIGVAVQLAYVWVFLRYLGVV